VERDAPHACARAARWPHARAWLCGPFAAPMRALVCMSARILVGRPSHQPMGAHRARGGGFRRQLGACNMVIHTKTTERGPPTAASSQGWISYSVDRKLFWYAFEAQRWLRQIQSKRRLSSRRLRAVLAGTDTPALLGHRYLDEQRAERALGAGAGGSGDRAGSSRRATSSFAVSEMEMVKQNDLPEQREVGAANHQVSTDPRTLQSALCAQPLTCGACPIVAQSFEPSC